jgi:predicted DsbA family dithiol-disulfide isomerase
MSITVDVMSDVICPWCHIGKRRLDKAVAAVHWQHEVRVRWIPFQLNPAKPEGGVSPKEYRIKKFGSWERSQEFDANLISVGEIWLSADKI